LLAQACAAFGVPALLSYAERSTPVDLLASFYNAINRREYQRAYGYWETPPSLYDQFVQGYADTACNVCVFYRNLTGDSHGYSVLRRRSGYA
jgi:hypothetical protein